MMDAWHWPQWTEAALFALSLISTAILDGDPKKGKHSFAVTLCSIAIVVFILHMGGFW